MHIFLQAYESRLDFYLKQDARYRDQFDPRRIEARQKNAMSDILLFWLRWSSAGSDVYQSVEEETSDELFQSVVIKDGEEDKIATLAMWSMIW